MAHVIATVLLACPQCAQNNGAQSLWLLAAMVLIPFPTAGLVAYLIKKDKF